MEMYRNNVGGTLIIPAAKNLRLAPGEIFDLRAYFPSGHLPWPIRQLLRSQAIVPMRIDSKQMQSIPFSSAPQGDSIRKAFFTRDISWTRFLQVAGEDKRLLVSASKDMNFLSKVAQDGKLSIEVTQLAQRRLQTLKQEVTGV